MEADELGKYIDQLGPTLIGVVVVVLIILPAVKRLFSDNTHALETDTAVLKTRVDGLENRIEVLENKRTRS